jgi:hypothetical protein
MANANASTLLEEPQTEITPDPDAESNANQGLSFLAGIDLPMECIEVYLLRRIVRRGSRFRVLLALRQFVGCYRPYSCRRLGGHAVRSTHVLPAAIGFSMNDQTSWLRLAASFP